MSYLNQRAKALGLTVREADKHGLAEDRSGNILQYIRYFNGEQVTFIPKSKRTKVDAIQNRRTIGMDSHLDSYEQPLYLKRFHPNNIPPGAGKYKFLSKEYTGFGAMPMPTNMAISAYTKKKKGGLCVGVEGYFKALALSVQGVESFAFSGISTYKLCEQVKQYLLKRKPESFVILYDGDALNTGTKTDIINDQRVSSFFNSAVKFAGDFFDFCKDKGLKTKIHFAMVHPEQQHKGVDDLLETATDKQKIVRAFQSRNSSAYFLFQRLSRTGYKKALEEFFALANHKDFYYRHQATIGEKPFIFSGARFQKKQASRHFNLLNYKSDFHTFELLDKPFEVDIPTTELVIDKYVSEANTQILDLLQQHPRIAFNAPTGTGKTTYFIRWAIATKTPLVITVPTISLCKQLAKKHGITPLFGQCSIHKRTEAMQSKVIVCTYDTLKHITDLPSRTLIVDESHNLVNAYGYRGKAVSSVFHAFDRAKQVVLLSGTQNRLLAKYAEFEFVNIRRKQSPVYRVFEVEAGQSSKMVSFLSRFEENDFSKDQIHFVYLNNRNQLNTLQDYLIKNGLLQADEIAMITRQDIDSGDVKIYNEIIRKEEITSKVKVVLCTCLIAEGININNTNIGNIYCIDIDCIDSFQQFCARFRAMQTVNIFSIRDRERKPKKGFKISTQASIKLLQQQATLQLEYLLVVEKQTLSDHPEEDLEYLDRILPEYHYQGQALKLVNKASGAYKVDLLSILFAERERKINFMFNALFYAELSANGFQIEGFTNSEATAATQKAYKNQLKMNRLARAAAIEKVKQDLAERPEVVIKAAKIHAKKKRSSTEHYRHVDTDQVSDIEAKKYLEEHQTGFNLSWFGYLLRAYSKFIGLNIPPDKIIAILETSSKAELQRFFRALRTCAELDVYNNRRNRLQLSIPHRAEIKAKKKIKEVIKQVTDADGKITSTALQQLINNVWTKRTLKPDLSGVSEVTAVTYTKEQARNLLDSLFTVEKISRSNHKEYFLTSALYSGQDNFLHSLCVQFFGVDIGENNCKSLEIIHLWVDV